jgi:hypothetical protein
MTHTRTFTAAFLALSITGYSGAQTVRCTTWNLQWFPNGSANEASAEQQNQRIKEAADVLRPINPDIRGSSLLCLRFGAVVVYPSPVNLRGNLHHCIGKRILYLAIASHRSRGKTSI